MQIWKDIDLDKCTIQTDSVFLRTSKSYTFLRVTISETALSVKFCFFLFATSSAHGPLRMQCCGHVVRFLKAFTPNELTQ